MSHRPARVSIAGLSVAGLLLASTLLAIHVRAEDIDDCHGAAQSRQYSEVLGVCKNLATTGDPTAAFHMGEAYEYINDQRRSGTTAAKWYLQAANQNHLQAQRNLAALYDSGFGVPKDPWYAFKWYLRAAEQGQPHSQLMVGMMYVDGTGTAQNMDEGKKWLQSAAQSGEPNAQYIYGKLLYEKTPEQGISWYNKAARQNNSYALYRLGLLHYRGEQLSLDYAMALQYAERAINAKHPKAKMLKQKILQVAPQLDVAAMQGKETDAGVSSSSMSDKKPAIATQTVYQEAPNEADSRPALKANTIQVAKVTKVTPNQAVTKSSAVTLTPKPATKTVPAITSTIAKTAATKYVNANDDSSWLLQQPPKNYCIQLALMSHIDGINRYFRYYGLQEQSHFYQAQFNAGPMYMLIYGSYPTLKQAQQAIKSLPGKVQKMKPWIRQMETLQKGYRPVAGHNKKTG
ncbi:MAG: SPOR domain-containing protein [Motiliproteus sp.]